MRPALLISTLVLLSACATTRTPEAPSTAPVSAFDKAREFDRIVVAGQPTLDVTCPRS